MAKSYNYTLLEAEMAYKKELEEKEKYKKSLKDKEEKNKADEIMNNQIKKKVAKENYNNFIADVHDYLLENFLYVLTSKSLLETSVTEVNESFLKAIIHEYVQSNGYYKIIDRMKLQNTMFLAESVNYLETYHKIITEDASEEDEVHEIDPNNRDDFYNDLDNESIENIADIIRRRVSQATEDFINKNMLDDINIKDILADTKEKIDTINTGNKEVDEEIKQEHTIAMKRKLQQIENRPKSVFEQLVYNISKYVINNEDIYMEYSDSQGKLDMDKIVDRAKYLYTFLEMLNTTRIENFNNSNILDAISVE